MTDNKTLTIAFLPFDGYGGVYPCLGLAQVLAKLGQKCVFLVNERWIQLITKEGFECCVFDNDLKNENKISFWNDFMAEFGHTFKLNAFDKIKALDFWTIAVNETMRVHHKLLKALNDLKPDVIIADNIVSVPAVQCTGIPWFLLCTAHPLHYLCDDRLPPGCSGLSAYGDKHLCTEFREEIVKNYGKLLDEFNEWHKSVGAQPLQHRGQFVDPSPYFNLYICPKELDYNDIYPKDPKKWFAVDNLCREDTKREEKKLKIPEEFRNRPGKLVYLSMGTFACSEVTLMKRLITILSKSKHRFIVSKDPFGDLLSLLDNMWGQNSLPQIQVLSIVDAVITHGGNNTVTECFKFGKPMIVFPIFGDQFDNAQRIQDKGLGVRLDPYLCSESDLLSTVDKIVNDLELRSKYEKISQRIRLDKTKEKAAKLVIDLIKNQK